MSSGFLKLGIRHTVHAAIERDFEAALLQMYPLVPRDIVPVILARTLQKHSGVLSEVPYRDHCLKYVG